MTDWGSVLVSGYGWGDSIEDSPKHVTQFTSNPVKGDGFVHRASGQHTIQVHTVNFSGNIAFEATMGRDPNIGPWVQVPVTNTLSSDVYQNLQFQYDIPVPGIPSSGKTLELNDFYYIVGNYTWIRANVSNISGGDIMSIKLAF